MKFGLLLPHFGEWADRDLILDGSRQAEDLGLDSVWVRDHLLFEPHGEMEKPRREFYDALTTLTAIGAVTERLELGTGSLIPFRHPLQEALVIATMTHFFGPRVIVGMGAGTYDHEFEAIGMGGIFRPELTESHAHILRKVWTEENASYKDDYYEFEDVTIEPKPVGDLPPYWYCGNTPASVRRAVDYCDGWMPGRISMPTLRARVEAMDEECAKKGRAERPTVGVIPPTSMGSSREDALSKVNVEGLLTWANKARFWVKPASGQFETADDLQGSLIAGTPEEVADELHVFADAGVEHLVFDLRFRFADWHEQIHQLGAAVAYYRDQPVSA